LGKTGRPAQDTGSSACINFVTKPSHITWGISASSLALTAAGIGKCDQMPERNPLEGDFKDF
jgi:hypothetical protein